MISSWLLDLTAIALAHDPRARRLHRPGRGFGRRPVDRSRRRSRRRCRPRCCRRRSIPASARARSTPLPNASCRRCGTSSAAIRNRARWRGLNRWTTPVPGKTASSTQRAPKAPPCAMVIFGAGGDLTRRLLIPAIYNLAQRQAAVRELCDHRRRPHAETARELSRLSRRGGRSFVSDTASGGETEPFDANDLGFHRQPHHPFRRRFYGPRHLCAAWRSA